MTAVKPTSHQLRNHNLREAFLAEDAARKATEAADIAISAAQSAKKYHTLIQSGVGDFDTRLDSFEFLVKAQAREIKALRIENADSRNQCFCWGIGGAIVASLITCFIFGPIVMNSQVSQPQPRVEVAK